MNQCNHFGKIRFLGMVQTLDEYPDGSVGVVMIHAQFGCACGEVFDAKVSTHKAKAADAFAERLAGLPDGPVTLLTEADEKEVRDWVNSCRKLWMYKNPRPKRVVVSAEFYGKLKLHLAKIGLALKGDVWQREGVQVLGVSVEVE